MSKKTFFIRKGPKTPEQQRSGACNPHLPSTIDDLAAPEQTLLLRAILAALQEKGLELGEVEQEAEAQRREPEEMFIPKSQKGAKASLPQVTPTKGGNLDVEGLRAALNKKKES